MSALHLLAALLLALPPGSPRPPAWAHPLLAPALRQAAVRRQWLDPREYWLQGGDFAEHLDTLRQCRLHLEGAPLAEDARRFPAREAVAPLLADNRAYRCELARRLALDAVHAEELCEAIAETDRLHAVWEAVADAQGDWHYVPVRREALRRLRALVGPAAYYRGELPPHLPVWRLPRR